MMHGTMSLKKKDVL